jgi:hypothetical protein
MEFTSFGADGLIVLTLSRFIAEGIFGKNSILSLNLKTALSKEQLNQIF